MARRPTTSGRSAGTSLRVAKSSLGTNSTCTGACGAMSRNAMTCSSSNTMSAGSSRRMMRWKIVGMAMRASESGSDSAASPRRAANAQAPRSVHFAARAERVRQGAAVDVLQFATQRHAVGEAAGPDRVLARDLRQVVRGRLALDGGIGGDDQFAHLALGQALGQAVEADLARPDAVERAQAALQHEIQAAIAGGLLDREPVGRRFDHAQLVAVARLAGAGGADRGLAEVPAALAVADALDRVGQHRSQAAPALAFALEHVVGHALGGFLADAGQDPEGLDQLFKERRHRRGGRVRTGAGSRRAGMAASTR